MIHSALNRTAAHGFMLAVTLGIANLWFYDNPGFVLAIYCVMSMVYESASEKLLCPATGTSNWERLNDRHPQLRSWLLVVAVCVLLASSVFCGYQLYLGYAALSYTIGAGLRVALSALTHS